MAEVRITDVDTYIVDNPWKPWVFAKLETSTGVHGVAEGTLHGKPRTVAAAIEELSHYVIGESPFDTERTFLRMYRDEVFSDNVINTTVASVIDVACWDIKGKIFDAPVSDLLGGSVHGDELRTYANGWYTDAGGTPAGFAAAAERVVSDGFDALKFDPFGKAWERMTRADLNQSIDIVAAVREAVGPDIDILIEGHGRFTPGVAIDIAKDLEPYKPTWFEEPTPPDHVDGLRQVAAKADIPIATGERHMSKYAFRDLLVETDVDVIQPDLCNTGGLTEGKKIAGMAEAEHVSVAPHNPQGPLATATYAHFDTSTPNFMIQESFETYDVDWKVDLLTEPVVVENGTLEVPDGPGLGVDLNLDAVEEHAYEGDDPLPMNLFEEGWESRASEKR